MVSTMRHENPARHEQPLSQQEIDALLGFAPDDDSPVPYMQRTRDWYLALGYNNPYRYAHFIDVPFTPLRKPLAESTVTLLTTAAPCQPDRGVSDRNAGTGLAAAGGCTRAAHHNAVATALEPFARLETRLRQHRTRACRRHRPPAGGVRLGQSHGEIHPRSHWRGHAQRSVAR